MKLRAKKRLLARPDYAGYVKKRIFAQGINLQELWDSLNSGGLFGEGEIIVIERVDELSAASKKILLDILEQWEADTSSKILVFISQAERMDATDPLEGHLIANSRACHVYFPFLTEAEVLAWARGELRRKKIEADGIALDMALEAYSNDLYSWMNLIENLEIYLGGPGRAGVTEVEKLLGISTAREDRIVEEINRAAIGAFAQGRSSGEILGRSLKAAEQLLISSAEGPPGCALRVMRIFADVVYELGVCKAGVYSSRRRHDPDLADLLDRAAGRLDWGGIKRLYSTLLEGERNIKRGLLPPETVLRKFLFDFTESLLSRDRKRTVESGHLTG